MVEDFSDGVGIYLFECHYEPATYCPVGLGLIEGDYWEFKKINYQTFEDIEDEYYKNIVTS